MPDPFIGRRLDGRYEIVGRLGAGGVGFVYRAKHVQLGRLVAIKVLQQFAATDPEWRRRFAREAKVLSALAHPNVVTVTDSGIDKGVPYLVMELLEGKTLGELLKEGPMPPPRALDIARQVLRGLAFAHGKGIVHRDLKPANVFLQALPDQADHVRLLDFGMAKFLEGSGSRSLAENLTQVGVVCGTPAYMSPEQGKAEPVDARTDVYAAGVVLFELLTGRQPFRGDSFEDVMRSNLFDPIPSLADARPDLSIAAVLQPVIERSMAKKPMARFPDAASMLAALEAIDAVSRAAAARGGGLVASQKEPISRAQTARAVITHSWKAAVGLATLAAALTTVFTFLRHNDARPSESARPPVAQPPSSIVPPTSVPPTQLKVKAQAQTNPEQPRLPARNPWQEAVPTALEPIRARLDRSARMSERSLRPVYLYAHQHPSDPRPWLLVGRAYAQLDWRSDSVERYLRAYRIDPGCRGDPQMLADLLKAADHPVAGRAAAKAIGEVYGTEAIPAVEKELERRAGDRDTTARLTRLRASLAR
jgi:serine/threonine-protein kinase